MTRIEFLPSARDDFKRFLDHMQEFEIANSAERIGEIINAIDILSHSPLIGRPAGHGNRELLIGRGGRGYVVLYRYHPRLNVVAVIALRHQREAGYAQDN